MTTPMEVCIHKCPDKEIAGNINNCPDFLKSDAEEYANDPTYQEYVKSHSQDKEPGQNILSQKNTQNIGAIKNIQRNYPPITKNLCQIIQTRS